MRTIAAVVYCLPAPTCETSRNSPASIARMVGRDLRCRGSVDSFFSEMVFDLFTSRTGSLQIFLCVAFYFRLSMLAALQFVAQRFHSQRQFGSVDCCDVAL